MNVRPLLPCLLAVFWLSPLLLQAQSLTQTLTLQPGWNSVWLQVEPAQPDPAALFAGQPVEMVTTFIPVSANYTSLRDPAADTWKEAEWRTWQPETSSVAFLNNLHLLTAGQGYLIKATAAATIAVPGRAVLHRFSWRPQSFNLVGLPADPAAPITLGAFFASSPAHAPLRAFKLLSGKWVPAASAEPAQPGKAYWIWSGKGSDHQGPISLRASGSSGGIVLASPDSMASVELRPAGASALAITLSAAGTLPLARLTSGTRIPLGTDTLTAPANEWTPFRLGHAAPAAMPASPASALLEIRAPGLLWYLPVTTIP